VPILLGAFIVEAGAGLTALFTEPSPDQRGPPADRG